MTKKVVIFSTVHSIDDTRITHRQALSLVKAGYAVELYAVGNIRGKADIKFHNLPRHSKKWKRLLQGWKIFRKLAKRVDVDIFHFHDPELLLWGVLLKWKSKCPVIYDAHEDLPKQIFTKPWIPSFLHGFTAYMVNIVEKYLAKQLDAIIVATESIGNAFYKHHCVTIVKNYPLDIPILYESRKNIILYVGGVSLLRGFNEMLEMMQFIPHELEAELHIIGPLQHLSLSKENLSELKANNIFLHGRLPFSAVQIWLARAKVGLVCLHPVENYRESLPVKMFEYMAAGIPIVATDFPKWRQIVESSFCGFVVNALDPQNIAAKVVDILKNEEMYNKLSKNSRLAFEKEYNWLLEEKKMLSLYRELLVHEKGELKG